MDIRKNKIGNFVHKLERIETELKIYADKYYFSRNRILKDNRIERMENGIIVFLGKNIKYKDKILELYFPSEFNKYFVIIRSIM